MLGIIYIQLLRVFLFILELASSSRELKFRNFPLVPRQRGA